jgi:hypothetical protein
MGEAGTPPAAAAPKTGRPNKNHRLVLEAIIWLDRTGAPCRDLLGAGRRLRALTLALDLARPAAGRSGQRERLSCPPVRREKRAAIVVGRSNLVIAWHLRIDQYDYQDFGGCFLQRDGDRHR